MSKSGYKGEGKSRLFKPCVSPCKHFITAGDTHEQCVACLGAGHAAAAFSEGADCPHCERLPLRSLRSRKSLYLYLGRRRQLAGAHSSIWSRKWRRASPYLRPLPPDRAPAPGELAVRRRQLPPTERARSTNLPSRRRRWRASMSQSLQYEELLEVVTRAVDKLKIDWPERSSRPSRAEANSTSVSCALGRHLRIGACRFFPICILRFVDRGEDRTRPASLFQRLTIMGMSRVWMSAVIGRCQR